MVALMYGIGLIAKLNIDKAIILGDSRQVIQKMEKGYKNEKYQMQENCMNNFTSQDR